MLLGGIADDLFGPITARSLAGLQTRRSRRRQASGGRQHPRRRRRTGRDLRQHRQPDADLGDRQHRRGAGQPDRSGDQPERAAAGIYRAPVGRLDQAPALQGIYLRQTAGDLVLGNINPAGSARDPVRRPPAASMPSRSSPIRTSVHIAGARSICAPAAMSASTARPSSRCRSRFRRGYRQRRSATSRSSARTVDLNVGTRAPRHAELGRHVDAERQRDRGAAVLYQAQHQRRCRAAMAPCCCSPRAR